MKSLLALLFVVPAFVVAQPITISRPVPNQNVVTIDAAGEVRWEVDKDVAARFLVQQLIERERSVAAFREQNGKDQATIAALTAEVAKLRKDAEGCVLKAGKSTAEHNTSAPAK